MARHRQRTMADLLKHASRLAEPRTTLVLEGRAQMEGPLDELDSTGFDFEAQKVCQNCRNSTEGSHIQSCDICGRGYHTFCLEPTLDVGMHNRQCCYKCQTVPSGQKDSVLGMLARTDSVKGPEKASLIKQEELLPKSSEPVLVEVVDAIGEPEVVLCDLEFAGVLSPDIDRNIAVRQFPTSKSNSCRKRVVDTSEEGSSSQVRIGNIIEEDEIDRKPKKFKAIRTIAQDNKPSEAEQHCRAHEESKDNASITKEHLVQEACKEGEFGMEMAIANFDIASNVEVKKTQNFEKLFPKTLIDVGGHSFSNNEKQGKRETEQCRQLEKSLGSFAVHEKAADRCLVGDCKDEKDGKSPKRGKTEQHMGSILNPSEQLEAGPDHLYRLDSVGKPECYIKGDHQEIKAEVSTACEHLEAVKGGGDSIIWTEPGKENNENKEEIQAKQIEIEVGNEVLLKEQNADKLAVSFTVERETLVKEPCICRVLGKHDVESETSGHEELISDNRDAISDVNICVLPEEGSLRAFVEAQPPLLKDTNHVQDVTSEKIPSERLAILHSDENAILVTPVLEASSLSGHTKISSYGDVEINAKSQVVLLEEMPLSSAIGHQLSTDSTVTPSHVKVVASGLDETVLKLDAAQVKVEVVGDEVDSSQSTEATDHSNRQETFLPPIDSGSAVMDLKNCLYHLESSPEQLGDISSTRSVCMEDDVKVCDICGDPGYEEMLVVCSDCNEGAEHVYCTQTLLDQVPEGYWLCEGCKAKQKVSDQRQSESQSAAPLITRSPSLSTCKKQVSFGTARLRLTARLEKRKVGPERKRALKGIPLAQGSAKGQAEDMSQGAKRHPEDLAQVPVKRQTEDSVGVPAKKLVVETSATLVAGTVSTLRPGLSREGSFKSPDTGKVKFLSPAALAGLSTAGQGTGNSVRGTGKPSLSSLPRTTLSQLGQMPNRSRFASLNTVMSDSTVGGNCSAKAGSSSPLSSTHSNTSLVATPSFKSNLPKSGDGVNAFMISKVAPGVAKVPMSHKSFKDIGEGVVQGKDCFTGAQLSAGNIRVLAKTSSFKSAKGTGGTPFPSSAGNSEQKACSDTTRIHSQLPCTRPANFDMIRKGGDNMLDSCPTISLSDSTTEPKAKALPCVVGTSNTSNALFLSDSTSAPKVDTILITSIASQTVVPFDRTMELKPNSLPSVASTSRTSSAIISLEGMVDPNARASPAAASTPSSSQNIESISPSHTVSDCRDVLMTETETMPCVLLSPCKEELGMLRGEVPKNSKLQQRNDNLEYTAQKLASVKDKTPEQSITQSGLLTTLELAEFQGERQVSSGAFSPNNCVKTEGCNVIGDNRFGAGNTVTAGMDLTCEEKLPLFLDKPPTQDEISRNSSPKSRTSLSRGSSSFMPSVGSTRCYKCKELGHSAQSCTGRSFLPSSIAEFGSGNMQPPPFPNVDSSSPKDIVENATVVKLKTAISPESEKLNKHFGSEVEVPVKLNNSQYPKLNSKPPEARCLEDGSQGSASQKVLEPDDTEMKFTAGFHDDLGKNCNVSSAILQMSSTSTVGVVIDTTIVSQGDPFPRSGSVNGRPSIVTSGMVAVLGNSMNMKEFPQRKPIVFDKAQAPDASCSAKFTFSTQMVSSVTETLTTTIPPVTSKGGTYWMSAGGVPVSQANSSASASRPTGQRNKSQVECLKSPVLPESYYLWRGMFEVSSKGNKFSMFDGIQAHPSNRAVPKVHEVARKLPSSLCLEELPRDSEHNSWPVQFQNSPPSDENIALYFFAKDKESYERSYKPLVDHMLKYDLALKGNVEDAELLVFPSNLLPAKSQRWNQFMFLWAVFRDRRPIINNPAGHHTMAVPRSLTNYVDAKPLQRMLVSSVGDRREVNVNVDLQGDKEEKLVNRPGRIEPSSAIQMFASVNVPYVHGQTAIIQPFQPPLQASQSLPQDSLQHDSEKISQNPSASRAFVTSNMEISSATEIRHPKPVPSRRDDLTIFDHPPGFGLITEKSVSSIKPAEEGVSHVSAPVIDAPKLESPVLNANSVQLTSTKECNTAESPRLLCQSSPSPVVCISPQERQADGWASIQKSSRSRSRSPGQYRDRDRGVVRDYSYERGKDRDRLDTGRFLYRERDKERERRYRERDRVRERDRERERERDWERERERDRNRDRERERGRERDRERERERGRERLGRDRGRRRDYELADREYERESRRWCRHSRSPPIHRERSCSPFHRLDRNFDRSHFRHRSRSYSNSPTSDHGSGRQHSPCRRSESRDRSHDLSRNGKLPAHSLSDPRVGDEGMVETKISQETLVEAARYHPSRDANCASRGGESTRLSREKFYPIADLNMNPVESEGNETDDLVSFPANIPCATTHQQSGYKSFLPTDGFRFRHMELGESSKSSGEVFLELSQAGHKLDLSGVQEDSTVNISGQTEPSSSHHHLFPFIGDHPWSAHCETRVQTAPNLDLVLGGAGMGPKIASELPLVVKLVKHQQFPNTRLTSAVGFSGATPCTAEDGNLELSLAFPEQTWDMQPAVGIDVNKLVNEEPVNTSLSLFGPGI